MQQMQIKTLNIRELPKKPKTQSRQNILMQIPHECFQVVRNRTLSHVSHNEEAALMSHFVWRNNSKVYLLVDDNSMLLLRFSLCRYEFLFFVSYMIINKYFSRLFFGLFRPFKQLITKIFSSHCWMLIGTRKSTFG